MTTPSEALAELVQTLSADGDLSPDDLALIHDAAVAATLRIKAERAIAETMHVHPESHVAVVTAEAAFEDQPESDWPEVVDASGLVCHDCGNELVSDAGTDRILVCPRVHGRRGTLRPERADAAVECGLAA